MKSFKNLSVEPERNEKLKILHFSRGYGILQGNAFKKLIRSVIQRVNEEKKVIFENQWGFSKIFTYGILLGTKVGNLSKLMSISVVSFFSN